jgi:hypothetical protein
LWIGPKPVPEEWIAAWRAMHPTWKHRLWREADLAKLSMVNRRHFDALLKAGIWHGAADIARYEILLAEGGVYVDVDSKPLRSFDGAPFMEASFFAGYEPTPSLPGRVANGTLGAEKGHHVIAQVVRAISEMEVVDPPWDTIGGTALTAILALHRHCSCKPMLLPPRTFYATDARGRQTPGREEPYSEHFWATTNRGYAGRVVVLVPRRAGDPMRDRVWEFVKAKWAAHWPVYEGHHDDGPFNAAAARNMAAKVAGEWDVAIFADADTIPRSFDDVKRAVTLAANSGAFVRPYRRYVNMDEAVSQSVLAGAPLPATPRRPAQWLDGAKMLTDAQGGIAVVPRDLYDRVGGYDERFRGWGSEDTAFALACTVMGGFKQTDGEVWHLWHPLQDRDQANPQYQANVALRRRYERSRRPLLMRELIDEHRSNSGPLRVGLVIITNGRKDCIQSTVASIEARVKPAFTEKIICDDSGDAEYVEWLKRTFPGFVVYGHPHLGHGPAVAYAFRRAAAMPADWVFFSEDDFEFTRDVDLEALANEMRAKPSVTQMVIRRQAWFPSEVEAGGMIERFDPALFTEHSQNGSSWIEHRQFYSLNPHLTRRSFIAAHPWPARPNSEHHFGLSLFRASGVTAGIWGAKADAPWARHFGERVGSGY